MTNYLNPQTQWLTTATVGDEFQGVTLVDISDHGPFLAVTLKGFGQQWTVDYPRSIRESR